MHDLGKIAVDDSILRKPGRFTEEEYNKMKNHAAKGAVIVAKVLDEIDDVEFKRIAVNVAHYHHEKWDGSGYPEHLKGTEIPLIARIIAVADSYDAMTSTRSYRQSMNCDQVRQELIDGKGTQFDPKCVEVFMDSLSEVKMILNKYNGGSFAN